MTSSIRSALLMSAASMAVLVAAGDAHAVNLHVTGANVNDYGALEVGIEEAVPAHSPQTYTIRAKVKATYACFDAGHRVGGTQDLEQNLETEQIVPPPPSERLVATLLFDISPLTNRVSLECFNAEAKLYKVTYQNIDVTNRASPVPARWPNIVSRTFPMGAE